jgi:sugar phosphate permease
MVLIGTLATIALYLIGVPGALFLGILTGLLEFVPLVGPTIVAIPPLLLGFTVSPLTALWVLATYVGIESYLVEPLVMQKAVSLHPAAVVVDNPEPEGVPDFKEYAGGLWKHVRERRVIGLFIGSLVTFVSLSFGASPFQIGLVVASTSLTTALTSSQMGRLSARFSEAALVRASFVLYAVALSLVPAMPSVWLLLVPTVVFGVAQSLNLPNSFSLLTAAAPRENRGAFISLNSTILRLGQTIGPLLMSAAATPFGPGGAYLAAAGVSAAMFFVALALIR